MIRLVSSSRVVRAQVVDAVKEDLARIDIGLAHVFIQHTSASLILNENADPDVRADFETWTRLAIPEGVNAPWVHTDEGADDMPAHIKAAMFGSSLTLPITNGRINLGTWQGIWLAEHRNNGGPRQLVITVQGQAKRR